MKRGEILLRRLTGFLISLVMAIGMMVTTAFAANGGESATITINKGSAETLKGMQVEAYRVLTVINPIEPKNEWIYQVESQFNNFFNIDNVKKAFNNNDVVKEVYLTYVDNHLDASKTKPTNDQYIKLTGDDIEALDATYGAADLISRLTSDTEVTSETTSENATLYTWIEKYIEESRNVTPVSTTVPAGENVSSIKIDNLKNGYYALIFKNVPDKVNVKQGILISTAGIREGDNFSDAELNLKAENIPFIKQVADSADPSASGITWGKNASAAVGDTLSYKLTTNVPNLTDYTNLTAFNISDTLSNQKLNADSITIKIGNVSATPVYDQNSKNIVSYTIGSGSETIATLLTDAYDSTKKKGSFTLTFVPATLESYQGKEIVVTYTAELTADAVKINDNTAKLEYTNNGDNNTLTAETEVYTYGIQIQKTFSDGSTTANYSSVIFKLYKKDGTAGFTLTGSDGIYSLSSEAASDTEITELELNNSDGTLTIYGLDDDVDYLLKETKTADNFNTVGDIVISLVAQSDLNGMLLNTNSNDGTSITVGGTKAILGFENNSSNSDSAVAIAKFTVLNQKGFELPKTGGAGTWMLTIGGIVLIAAAGILYFASKNKADA